MSERRQKRRWFSAEGRQQAARRQQNRVRHLETVEQRVVVRPAASGGETSSEWR